MGQYVYITIATKIIASKTGRFHFGCKEYGIEEVREKLAATFCMDLYDTYQNEEYICFILKQGILEKYLYDFLYEQSFYLFCGDQIRDELDRIKNLNEEIVLNMLRNEELEYFHYMNFDVMKSDYLAYDLEIYSEGIHYLSDGKIHMECYSELFQYINKVIRKSSKNPLKDTVYVMIVG